MTTIRTRFAPSPTGYLHIGGARTALYSWLYAKKTNGVFILRIEDTDLERSTKESVQAILDGMDWLGLDYQEGPFYQTERFDRYREVIDAWLAEGKAYRCYCSKERLEKLREDQMANKQKPRYDGHCRDLTAAQEGPYVVRFRNPQEGQVVFHDLVRGDVAFANAELDDLIIARSDGSPTYNFTVVIDDADMQISHVLRGDDHINNTPRQINMFAALGAKTPEYAHVPMILGPDGKRLSKRHGAVGVMQYREDGYLPQALLNYLVRLGWSHGDQEIFTMAEMIEYFDIHDLNRSAAAVNPDKLLWLNQHYMKTMDPKDLASELAFHLEKLGVQIDDLALLEPVIVAQRERCKTLKEMAEKSHFFFEEVVIAAEDRTKLDQELLPFVASLHDDLSKLADWTEDDIQACLKNIVEANGLKFGKLAQPVRLALTGSNVSPPLNTTMALLGREKTLARLASL